MAGKPQTLSEGQRKEVTSILRKQVAIWTLSGLALLTGITGVGLWQILIRIQKNMETLVAEQFKEPRIKATVEDAARSQASSLLSSQVQPEVAQFKKAIARRLEDLDALVSRTQTLEEGSKQHAKAVSDIHATLQRTLQDSQNIHDRIVGLQSDVVRMQKCTARVQYYLVKGRNTFPNPYAGEMLTALNEMLSIALPNPSERNEFIKNLGGSEL